ncbi:MAG: hypothetical protein MAG451_00852 [Anaerolineales bacterium]|nr:hypothetical protein [Anaerolineales bacterium]
MKVGQSPSQNVKIGAWWTFSGADVECSERDHHDTRQLQSSRQCIAALSGCEEEEDAVFYAKSQSEPIFKCRSPATGATFAVLRINVLYYA